MSTPSSPSTPPPVPPVQAAARPRRVWRVVLVLSLALNVMVAGMVIGGVIRASGPGGAPGSAMPGDMRGLFRALPQESRAALRQGLSERGERRPRAQDARRDGAAILEALETEPFDPQALIAVIEGQRLRQDAERRAATEAFAAQVGALTAEQRQQMARDLRVIWRRQMSERP